MKIALSQLDYHIGNFTENKTNIILEIKKAEEFGIDLVVFSELSICGYPPLKLLERIDFTERCIEEINRLAGVSKTTGVIIGGPSINTNKKGQMLYNSAYFLYKGEIKKIIHKSVISFHNPFPEYRYFEPNREFRIIEFKGKKVALTISEDIWDKQAYQEYFGEQKIYSEDPVENYIKLGADLIINIAASSFSHSKVTMKRNLLAAVAGNYQVPIIYVNQVGAQNQLLFEGGSMAIDRKGNIVEQLQYFIEDTRYVDTDFLEGNADLKFFLIPDRIKMIHDALVMGINGYFSKSGLTKAVMGLSGGLDSAVALVLTVRALGKKNVHALLMPSSYSSSHSIADSVELAGNLDISYDILSIEEIFRLFNSSLEPVFQGMDKDVTEENIQARIRAVFLMAYSNKFGHILLNTSNKSEMAVGYSTLYGDMSGGLSVLGDVYKTDVYKLARYINKEDEIIPENILTKPPSAELRPDQKDTDSLPEYDILDKILNEYLEQQKSADQIINEGFEESLVRKIISLVNSSEYKRFQAAPVLRISSRALDDGHLLSTVPKY